MSPKRLPKTPSRPRSDAEFLLLKKIGRKINSELFKSDKTVEWLAFESETARSTIRRMFDGEGNIGIVTYDRVARALGHRDIISFFKEL